MTNLMHDYNRSHRCLGVQIEPTTKSLPCQYYYRLNFQLALTTHSTFSYAKQAKAVCLISQSDPKRELLKLSVFKYLKLILTKKKIFEVNYEFMIIVNWHAVCNSNWRCNIKNFGVLYNYISITTVIVDLHQACNFPLYQVILRCKCNHNYYINHNLKHSAVLFVTQ